MRVEILEAGGDVPALFTSVDTRNKQVDEPREAVLVHRLNVGQVRYAEEKYLARVRDGAVATSDLLALRRCSEMQQIKRLQRCPPLSLFLYIYIYIYNISYIFGSNGIKQADRSPACRSLTVIHSCSIQVTP